MKQRVKDDYQLFISPIEEKKDNFWKDNSKDKETVAILTSWDEEESAINRVVKFFIIMNKKHPEETEKILNKLRIALTKNGVVVIGWKGEIK
jgi:hypothetical protein